MSTPRIAVVTADPQAATVVQPEAIPEKPTWADVVTAIVDEIGKDFGYRATRREARLTIHWINGFVQRARRNGYKPIYPTDLEMSGTAYRVFDMIMPHGKAPMVGSAADMVNQLLLDPARGENSIWHDQRRVNDRVHCHVTVTLFAIT